MHPTSCSRRLGYILSHQCSRHAFFPANSINSAMPALLTCPAASELAAPGGPEIDVGEVIRKNLERTRSQEGWIAVWADISIYLMHIDSCMQDLAHAEMVSPSSSASEMEPVKDPNQRWLNSKKSLFLFWLRGRFAYASGDCFKIICRQGAFGSAAESSPGQVFLQ